MSASAGRALPALLAIAGAAATARADAVPAPPAATGKKAAYLAAKSAAEVSARARWQRELDRRVGKPPAPVVNVINTWTDERLPVEPGRVAALPTAVVNRFFRCHFTNEPTEIDPRLVRVLIDAASHFGVRRVDIVSGFRAPKYNLVLQKKGREVSRRSQHTFGRAVDFRLPGVATARLHAWAKALRLGGVGLYPNSGFIHVDTGPVRYWGGQ